MKNNVSATLKSLYKKAIIKLAPLKHRLSRCPRWVLLGASAGSLAICCIIGVLLYTADNTDTNMDLRSPQYEVIQNPDQFDTTDKPIFTADDGIVVIPAASDTDTPSSVTSLSTDDTDAIWNSDNVVTYNSFTVRDKVKQENGSLGVLNIPKIGLSVNVFQSESEMESMTNGVAHFGHTSAWDGNIGLCAHNVNFDLTDGYFKNLYQLKKGDEIQFSSELGERSYTVSVIREISDTDWTALARTPDNRITMITCISGKSDKRLLVQAVENR